MRKSILVFSLILWTCSWANTQVTSIKYLIEYNDSTTYYDCKIVIEKGEGSTVPQRIQFNAQYTFKVPTGSNVSIVESHNPIIQNQNYTGTIPLQWEIRDSMVAPYNYPDHDFYAITPDLSITAHYNNLEEGDTIPLFSLAVDIDPCLNGVQPLEDEEPHGYFPDILENYMCGFTLGNTNQLYNGNLKSSYGIIEDAGPYILCPGTSATIETELDGVFMSENNDIAQINEESGLISAISKGETTITFINESSGCQTDIPIIVNNFPEVTFVEGDQICVNESSYVLFEGEGVWFSSDPNIATIDMEGIIQGKSSGSTFLTFTDSETGCISAPLHLTVLPESDPSCIVNVKDVETNKFLIYPNPATNMVNIQSKKAIQSISIYTLDFRKVNQVWFDQNDNLINLPIADLKTGLYFLGIESNDQQVFHKLQVH